jgi:predicted nuclease of restriction endonuclease-like (RecB) superfamily
MKWGYGMELINPQNSLPEYGAFIKDVKALIYRRQYEAMKQVNKELIALYWEIGEEIHKKQTDQGWGKSIVAILSQELQTEFPGVQGFSARNLWQMRNFYLEFSQTPNLQPLVAEISWTKITIIMQKIKEPLEREFYIRMTKRFGWTKAVLLHHLGCHSYEKYLLNQTNFDQTVPEKYRLQAKLAVKDDYNFDFLEMGREHSEAELEAGLVNNIRAFLTEMGGDFTFIGNQHHLKIDGDDYYIDLLLFHRRLHSLIAIELKIGEFIPEYAGKMQFYLTALDKKLKLPEENPSIGIIICTSKKRTRVEYTLKDTNKPIGVATYNNFEVLPDEMRTMLPTPEQIAEHLKVLDTDLSSLETGDASEEH